MNKKFVATVFILALSWCGFSQKLSMKVGTNPTLINSSATLEVESTTKGFLPPRMTTEQMLAIVNPADGLMVFNTTVGLMAYFHNGVYYSIQKGTTFATPLPPTGSTYTAHYNGITAGISENKNFSTYTSGEIFSNNSTCASKVISASAQGCNGLTQVTGVSGTVYPLVNINGQCWFKTNLKEVPTNFASYTVNSWSNTLGDQGYWGYYNTSTPSGTSGWGTTQPALNEGYLYQWSAAMNNASAERAQGACPNGFHVPSDCEWMYLEHGLGMALSEQVVNDSWRANTTDSQGTPGYKLLNSVSGQANANASGFSGYLAGYRFAPDGYFSERNSIANWWTSTTSVMDSTKANYRILYTGYRGVVRFNNSKAFAFSVRCLKD